MREFFSRIDQRSLPFHKREIFQLCLDDADPDYPGKFVLREGHVRWDEARKQIVWEDVQTICLPNLEEARLRYAERRHALKVRGFSYSISTPLQ